jgi:hypothetical protein
MFGLFALTAIIFQVVLSGDHLRRYISVWLYAFPDTTPELPDLRFV